MISEKLTRSRQYALKGETVEELAKKLKIEIKKITDEDLKKVRKILSRGESLSKMVVRARGA